MQKLKIMSINFGFNKCKLLFGVCVCMEDNQQAKGSWLLPALTHKPYNNFLIAPGCALWDIFDLKH